MLLFWIFYGLCVAMMIFSGWQEKRIEQLKKELENSLSMKAFPHHLWGDVDEKRFHMFSNDEEFLKIVHGRLIYEAKQGEETIH